jgi:hypothetical protein
MMAWYVPLETFPDTNNGRPLGLDVIAEAIAWADLDGFLDHYRDARGSSRKARYRD